jgi:hypothetical protein
MKFQNLAKWKNNLIYVETINVPFLYIKKQIKLDKSEYSWASQRTQSQKDTCINILPEL